LIISKHVGYNKIKAKESGFAGASEENSIQTGKCNGERERVKYEYLCCLKWIKRPRCNKHVMVQSTDVCKIYYYWPWRDKERESETCRAE